MSDKHWQEVMKLAEEHGFIVQSYGGAAILATHANQKEHYGEEEYLRIQRMNGRRMFNEDDNGTREMNLEQAIKILDDQIPHPDNRMVDYVHKHISYAWLMIKESLTKFNKMERDLKEIQDNPGLGLCIICKYGARDMNTYPCKYCLLVSHFELRMR